jgi:hypothetical protein
VPLVAVFSGRILLFGMKSALGKSLIAMETLGTIQKYGRIVVLGPLKLLKT